MAKEHLSPAICSSLWTCWWTVNDLKATTAGGQETIWPPCLPARLFLPCQAENCPTTGLTDKEPAGWKGRGSSTDGWMPYPSSGGGPFWWAKETTGSGEGKGSQYEVSTLWLHQIHHPDKSSLESVCVVTARRMTSSSLGEREMCWPEEKGLERGTSGG